MKRYLYISILLLSLFYNPLFVVSQTPLALAPDFNVVDARGNYHNLYYYLNDNKYVLLDFFYNECLVCQTHVPEVNEAYLKFGCNTQEVIFMGINFNNTDGEVINFENEYELHYPNVSGINGNGNQIVDLFEIIAFPTIILIAPDKSIPKQDIWPLTAVNIVDEIMSVGIDTAVCPYLSNNKTPNLYFVTIYPNPTSDFLYIKTSSQLKNSNIQIFDFTGKLVLNLNTSIHFNKKIDLTQFSKGFYYLKIEHDSKVIHSEKITIY